MNNRTPWSRAELDALQQMVEGDYRYAEIARHLGRTVRQVESAAQRLGLQSRERAGWNRIPADRAARLREIIADCIEVRRMTCLDTTRYLNAIGEPVSNTWVDRQIAVLGRQYRKQVRMNTSRVRSLKTGIRRRAEEAKGGLLHEAHTL